MTVGQFKMWCKDYNVPDEEGYLLMNAGGPLSKGANWIFAILGSLFLVNWAYLMYLILTRQAGL